MDGRIQALSEAPVGGLQDQRRTHEDRIRRDEVVHGRLQRRLLEFDQLQWEGRRSLALKACAEILGEFGFELQADDCEPEWMRVEGWGQRVRVPIEQLKQFLTDLVQPRPQPGADANCRNCGSLVMVDDPGCWQCSTSFMQREWRPERIGSGRRGMREWWRRLMER